MPSPPTAPGTVTHPIAVRVPFVDLVFVDVPLPPASTSRNPPSGLGRVVDGPGLLPRRCEEGELVRSALSWYPLTQALPALSTRREPLRRRHPARRHLHRSPTASMSELRSRWPIEGERRQAVGARIGDDQVAGGIERDGEGHRRASSGFTTGDADGTPNGPTPNTSMSLPLAFVVTMSCEPDWRERDLTGGVHVLGGVRRDGQPQVAVRPGQREQVPEGGHEALELPPPRAFRT